MDALKAEIASKRKARDNGPSRPNKYMRRGDIERMKEEEERKAREDAAKKAEAEAKAKQAVLSKSPRYPAPARSTASPPPDTGTGTPPPTAGVAFNISNEETIRRLRAKGQPIRLFGEATSAWAGRTTSGRRWKDVESAERLMRDRNANSATDEGSKGKKKDESASGDGEIAVLDMALIKTDPDKLYPIIYYALKRVLKEWGESMAERPEHVKRTTQGKLAAATQGASIPGDMLPRLAEIVHHMQKRQYQRANDAYLRLSIGNAPWPIGVTMVGIHERSAREKISSDQVAHVLNDEVSRKYIQSLKRLLTFSQIKYPPDDVSQLMG
ncbi:hypothetical protein EDB89DRAFT_2181419 [Lactarius sanguifluus]|nr:hypothetical protein EDB89DRAFT_2181419 [Lactarius sanguifluus]